METRDLPDFSTHGYEAVAQLGVNGFGGRVTYIALQGIVKAPVVIKQFQLAAANAGWLAYEEHKREVAALRGLNHPGIPTYLNHFEDGSSFYLIQEYIKASPSTEKSFSLREVVKIAEAVLEILLYLQSLSPPIIHRNIKPENILIDGTGHVSLVNFGLATINQELTVSGYTPGTFGLISPEELFSSKVSGASDIYSLGITLICLLADIKSADIVNYFDEDYELNIKKLLPDIGVKLREWLQKMVAFRVADRFPDAKVAICELKTIDIENEEWEFLTKRYQKSVLKQKIKAAILFALSSISLGIVLFSYLSEPNNTQQIVIPAHHVKHPVFIPGYKELHKIQSKNVPKIH